MTGIWGSVFVAKGIGGCNVDTSQSWANVANIWLVRIYGCSPPLSSSRDACNMVHTHLLAKTGPGKETPLVRMSRAEWLPWCSWAIIHARKRLPLTADSHGAQG